MRTPAESGVHRRTWLASAELAADSRELESLRARVRELEERIAECCVCLESLEDGDTALILKIDAQGRILDLSAALAALAGVDVEAVRGQDFFAMLVPPSERAWARQRFARDHSGEPQVVGIATRSGGLRRIRWSVAHLAGESRDDTVLLAFGEDVTEKLEAEAELLREDQLRRSLVAHSPDVLWMIDLATRRLAYVSASCELLFGVSPERALEDPARLLERVHPDDRDALRAMVTAVQAGELWSGELVWRMNAADGSPVWVRSRYRTVVDAEGRRVQLVGSSSDVTRSTEAERRARERHALLERSLAVRSAERDAARARVLSVLERLGAPAFVCAPDGALLEANRAGRSLRARAGGATARSLGELFEPEAGDAPGGSLLDALARAAAGDPVHLPAHLRQLPGGTADALELVCEVLPEAPGRAAPLLVRVVPASAPKTFPRAASATIDGHERGRRSKEDLQLVSSLLFLAGQRSDEPAARAALVASKERVRALAAVYDRADPATGSVDLTGYLLDLVEMQHARASEAAGKVELQVALEPTRVRDELAVPCGLAVRELLANATSHAFPGARAGRVRVELAHEISGTDPRALRIVVEDDGVGLGEHRRGLGLDLAARLAAELGGTLELGPGANGTGVRAELRFRG